MPDKLPLPAWEECVTGFERGIVLEHNFQIDFDALLVDFGVTAETAGLASWAQRHILMSVLAQKLVELEREGDANPGLGWRPELATGYVTAKREKLNV